MKGRCSGVSLFGQIYSNFYKIKETLPGALKYLYCSPKNPKREAPHCTCKAGSLTIEASVIIPLFCGVIAFLLFYFRVMEVQIVVQNALEDTGRKLAILAVKELEEPEEEISYLVMAKGMLSLKLKDEPVIEQHVGGGALGIGLLMSEFEGDYIQLKANYAMHFPIELFGNQNFVICQTTYFRKWNGWHGQIQNDGTMEMVYVTEYGEVYHMRRSCVYLDLSIQKILYMELPAKQNYNGEIYRACELCSKESTPVPNVYITNYGDCYHNTITCSGLKRTIYQKLLSEVGGMPACKKCSK